MASVGRWRMEPFNRYNELDAPRGENEDGRIHISRLWRVYRAATEGRLWLARPDLVSAFAFSFFLVSSLCGTVLSYVGYLLLFLLGEVCVIRPYPTALSYSSMQNPRHTEKFLDSASLTLYKQPHLAQFLIVITLIGAWSTILHPELVENLHHSCPLPSSSGCLYQARRSQEISQRSRFLHWFCI